MILNLGSLAFNANIAGGGGTPTWGTELGQGVGYRFNFEDAETFLTSMLYMSVEDTDKVFCPLGKGGSRRDDYEFVVASLYERVYVNGIIIPDAKFILLIVKQINGDYHIGRRSIKYNPRMTYRGIEYNKDCYDKIPDVLGISSDAAWFIDEIYTNNQDELHFVAYVLDGHKGKVYASNDDRKKDFLSKISTDKISNKVIRRLYNCENSNSIRQQIFYGAPGTGKSHIINDKTSGESVIRTTFHPDSDYSTFVGSYKPTTKEVPMRDVTGKIIVEHGKEVTEDRIVYEFVEQAFLKAYIQAWRFYAQSKDNEAKKQFLVIEEINRGNCAQIFGDLFQLLDRNEQGFSDYPISADSDMRKQLAKAFAGVTFSVELKDAINSCYRDGHSKDYAQQVLDGKILLLPNNFYIWATMNTSDQSLFPIDSAFKRRWDWKYMPISEGVDKDGNEMNWSIVIGKKSYDWWKFLTAINEVIGTETQSEDKKLGFFFCKADANDEISADKFVNKVLFYLWNDVFKTCGVEYHYKDGDDEKLLTFDKFHTKDGFDVKKIQDWLELDLSMTYKTKETTTAAVAVEETTTKGAVAVEETTTEGIE